MKKIIVKNLKLNYKYVFKSFSKFNTWNNDDIVEVLELYGNRIVVSLLELFFNNKLFVVKKISEYNTMSANSWPKDHNIKSAAKEESADSNTNQKNISANNKVFAEIYISYSYSNPRDGDGWSLDISFYDNIKTNTTYLKLRTFSHSDVPKLSLSIDNKYSTFLENIQSIFNQIFNESTTIEKD